MAIWPGSIDFMPLIPHRLSSMPTHKFTGSLDMAQVKLVSMVIVNNGLLPVERHELQNIINKGS